MGIESKIKKKNRNFIHTVSHCEFSVLIIFLIESNRGGGYISLQIKFVFLMIK